MKKHILLILLLLCFVLGACTQASISSPTSPAETQDIASADSATPTNSPAPTEVPPTASATSTEALASPTEEPTPTATNTPSPLDNYPAEGYGPIRFPEDINPLTGLPAASPGLLDRRPIAVKISNGPRGIRPQWGLSLADHVYEYYHEVGRTRFNAIFYGEDAALVGPIRSARFADEHIIRMYKAFFAFGSADARVLWRLFDTGFGKRFATVTDAPCPPEVDYPLCRTDPNGYNHLVTDTAVLSEHFTHKGVANTRQYLDGLSFQATPPESLAAGSSLAIRYSQSFYSRWDYDPAYGQYVRYQDSVDDHSGGSGEVYEVLTDRLTGEPIRADNVVVLFAAHNYYSRSPEMWEIKLFGYGNGYLFRNGRVYEVSWARTGDEELIALTYPDGSRFPLRPGNTWFQIIGTSSSISNEGDNWRFEHVTP